MATNMSWRTEYLGTLKERDALEHINKDIYETYTKLADRLVNTHQSSPGVDNQTTGGSNINQIQADLTEAQKARSELTKKLSEITEELEKLQAKSKDEGKRIMQLTAERNMLTVRLRDRDEELRTKKKLLDDVHDETVALTLQLNVKEEQNQKLKKENQELVDRWMARMGQEAEAMNTASKFS